MGPGCHDIILDVHDLWLIDYYGGASSITPADYYAVPSSSMPTSTPPGVPVEDWLEAAEQQM